jgi:Concanavalin A-like lectin/glucanases superfamily/Bacterial TSP3 repeat
MKLSNVFSRGARWALMLTLASLWGNLQAQYPPPTVTDSLLLYSPLDNATVGAGAGADSTADGPFAVQDIAGTAEDGSAQDLLTGAATVTSHVTSGAAGVIGEALSFDPTATDDNRSVTYGDVHNIGTGDYSVSLWFNTVSTVSLQFIAGKGNQGSTSLGWSFFIQNGSLFARVGGGNSGNRASQNTTAFAADAWYHLVMVIDNTAGTVTAYLNGSNAGWANGGGGPSSNTFVAGTDISNSNPLTLGIRTDGAAEFQGYIDDVAIWDRTLTALEVAGIYQAGLAGNGLTSSEDTDGDGLPDAWENLYGLNPNDSADAGADGDMDGLTNLEEFQNQTNPMEPDTDSDGLSDGAEVHTHGTNPAVADTDGDGLDDGAEINTHGTDPLAKDTDGDGLSDGDEVNVYQTSPTSTDSDSDGFSDGLEVLAGSDPNDPGDGPQFNVTDQMLIYYPFNVEDVQDGFVLDRAGALGGPFDGLLSNGGPTTGVEGFIGEGVEFAGGPNNGDNHFIDLSDWATSLDGLAEGTVAAWVKVPNEGLTTDVLTIFGASDRDDPSSEVRFWVSNGGSTGTGTLAYGVRNDGTGLGTISSGLVNPLLDGAWHHVAVTVSNGLARLFMDGQETSSGASTFLAGVSDVDTAGVGRNQDNTAGGGQWFFDGSMDEWALWSRPLSAAEIQFIVEQSRRGQGLLPPEPDSDGDGIPDSYETAHGLNPNLDDAQEDKDGDGQSNLNEYLAGTAADDANSFLHVVMLAGDPVEFTIIWSSVPGKVYTVEASPDLSPDSWAPLAGAESIPASTGDTTNFEDESSFGLGQRFFRVRLVR